MVLGRWFRYVDTWKYMDSYHKLLNDLRYIETLFYKYKDQLDDFGWLLIGYY